MENMERIKKKIKIIHNSITTVNIFVHFQSFFYVDVLLRSPFMRDMASSCDLLWDWPWHSHQRPCVLEVSPAGTEQGCATTAWPLPLRLLFAFYLALWRGKGLHFYVDWSINVFSFAILSSVFSCLKNLSSSRDQANLQVHFLLSLIVLFFMLNSLIHLRFILFYGIRWRV